VAEKKIPLTTCPNSNDRLKVVEKYFKGNRDIIRKCLEAKLTVTVNSDDPAYFGGYMNSNFEKAQKDSNLSEKELVQLCHNAIKASFTTPEEQEQMTKQLNDYKKFD
jgi:adenosine deaminase